MENPATWGPAERVVRRAPAPPVADLDLTRLGVALMFAATTSIVAGHTRVALTLGTYCHGAEEELEFVRDLLCENNEFIIRRWFGSDLNAGRIRNAYTEPLK